MFRKWACRALEEIGRNYRLAYQSPSTYGILAAVTAGLAVTVLAASVVPPQARVLGIRDGFPELPETTIVLQRAPGSTSPVVDGMANYIREGLQS